MGSSDNTVAEPATPDADESPISLAMALDGGCSMKLSTRSRRATSPEATTLATAAELTCAARLFEGAGRTLR